MASVGRERSGPIGAVHPDTEKDGQKRAFQQGNEKRPILNTAAIKKGGAVPNIDSAVQGQDVRFILSKKLDYIFALLVTVLTLVVYMLTAAPGITWSNGGDDSAELSTAAYYLGVGHPTGYPLYLLLAQPFIRLLVTTSDPAARMVFFSSFCASIACGLMFFAVLTLLRESGNNFVTPGARTAGKLFSEKIYLQPDRMVAAATALGLGFSPLLWSQAVITEVYSLEALLLAGSILLAVLLYRDKKAGTSVNKTYLFGFFLVAGLGAGHHRTLLISLPGLFLLAGMGTWRKLKWFEWPLGAIIFLTGMMGPYLYQWLREFSVPEASWGEFWWNLTGQAYQGILFKGAPGNIPERLSAASGTLLAQDGALALGWLVAMVGFASATRGKMVLWFVILLSVALHTFFTVIYPAENGQVYLLPASIWLVLGVGLGWQAIFRNLNSFFRKKSWLVVLAFIPAAFSLAINWQTTNASTDFTAQEWAVRTLDTVQPDTLVVVDTDAHYFSLWYYRFVKQYRPGVIVVDSRPLGFDWYQSNLHQLYPDLVVPRSSSRDDLIKANRDKRPIEIIPSYNEIG